jgi:hypothetical protein
MPSPEALTRFRVGASLLTNYKRRYIVNETTKKTYRCTCGWTGDTNNVLTPERAVDVPQRLRLQGTFLWWFCPVCESPVECIGEGE